MEDVGWTDYNYALVHIKKNTYRRLLELGKMHNTFNDVIVMLLDEHDSDWKPRERVEQK